MNHGNYISSDLFLCGKFGLDNSISKQTMSHSVAVLRSVQILSQVHYDDVIMMAIASQITSLTIVYSAVYSDAHQRKHQSSASLAFVWGIHRGPVNPPHKWPVTRKMFPFDDVIMSHVQITHDYIPFWATYRLLHSVTSKRLPGKWFHVR